MSRKSTTVWKILSLVSAILVSQLSGGCSHTQNPATEDRSVRVVYCVKNVPASAIITEESLTTKLIDQSERPTDALYDPWIAIGRPAEKKLEEGYPVIFQQVFSKEQLKSANTMYIQKVQGDYGLYPERADRDLQQKIPVVCSSRNISAGTVIDPSDLIIRRVEERKCPGDALGDLRIAAGREAIQDIKAGEFVYYNQVIPPAQWSSWLGNKNATTIHHNN